MGLFGRNKIFCPSTTTGVGWEADALLTYLATLGWIACAQATYFFGLSSPNVLVNIMCGPVQLDRLISLKVKKNLPTTQPPLPLCAKTLRFRLKKVRCDFVQERHKWFDFSNLDKMEG